MRRAPRSSFSYSARSVASKIDHVGGELVAVLGDELRERAGAELLLPLEERHEAEVEVGADGLDEGTDGGHVGHDAGLVIRSATAVQAVAPHGRFERVGLPVCGVAGRLHVVVRVEQDRSTGTPSDCGLDATVWQTGTPS